MSLPAQRRSPLFAYALAVAFSGVTVAGCGASTSPGALSTNLSPKQSVAYYIDQGNRYFDVFDTSVPAAGMAGAPTTKLDYAVNVARFEWPPWLKLTGYGRDMIRGADPIAVKDHPSTVPVRDCRAFAVQPFGRCRVTFHYAEGDCPIYEEFTFNDAGEMTFVEAWSDRPGLLPTTDPNDAWAEGKGAEPVHRLSTRIPGLGTPTGQFDPTAPSTTAAATADAEVADFVDRTQDFVSYYLAEYKAVGKDVYKRGCGW